MLVQDYLITLVHTAHRKSLPLAFRYDAYELLLLERGSCCYAGSKNRTVAPKLIDKA